ncbi:MAG: hypothetical protein K2X93_23320 [Candidatus Obscuribacterales bacterium]|nr:hypothetical protein [Candidatus Obscuribacterales bacterium]
MKMLNPGVLCAVLLLSACGSSNRSVRSYYNLMLFENHLSDGDEARQNKQPEQASQWYKFAISEGALADSHGYYKAIAQVSAAQNAVYFRSKSATEKLSVAAKSLYQCLKRKELQAVSQTICRTLIHVIRLDVEVALRNGNIVRVDRRINEVAELLKARPDMLKIPETKYELFHLHRVLASSRRGQSLGIVQELEKLLPAKGRDSLEMSERVHALRFFHEAETFKRDNQPGAAIDQLNRALSLAIDLNDVSLQLSIYVEVAKIEAARGNVAEMKRNLDHAMQLAHELKDDNKILKVINFSLRIQQKMPGIDLGTLYKEHAEEVRKIVGDGVRYADFFREAGLYSLKIERLEDAEKFADEASKIYSRLSPRSSSGQQALNEILKARIAEQQDKKDKSASHLAEAIRLATECTDPKLKVRINRELSRED